MVLKIFLGLLITVLVMFGPGENNLMAQTDPGPDPDRHQEDQAKVIKNWDKLKIMIHSGEALRRLDPSVYFRKICPVDNSHLEPEKRQELVQIFFFPKDSWSLGKVVTSADLSEKGVPENTILLITGQHNNFREQLETAVKLGVVFEKNILLMENISLKGIKGHVTDTLSTAFTKWGWANRQVKTLVSLLNGEFGYVPKKIIAHSQGAAQLALSLKFLGKEILEQLHIVTMGGAGTFWHRGPTYKHYVNWSDFVPLMFGVPRNNQPEGEVEIIDIGIFTHAIEDYISHFAKSVL